MPTAYDTTVIIVARPAFAAAANQAASEVDLLGGADTFTVPLRTTGDATNTIQAYWCRWAMKSSEALLLRDRLRANGASTSDVAIVPASRKGNFTWAASSPCVIFDATDGTGWTPFDVLTALNLRPLASGLPE